MMDSKWYREWHENRHHHIYHWGLFISLVLLLTNSLLIKIEGLTYATSFPIAQAATPSLLQTSDLTCAGMFLSPWLPIGSAKGQVAMRYESDGKRHYFMYPGDGHVYEFPEPVLSPCNTPLTSVNRASLENWGGDWGVFNVNAGGNFIPGQNATYAFGLGYDNISNQLLLSWTNTYSFTSPHNTFAGATLDNSTHSLKTVGCWGVANTTMPVVGSGVLNIPNSFAGNLPTGARYGIGFGGSSLASVTGGISEGPSLIALQPGSPNSCAPNTDYFISGGTVLSQYPANANGPSCSSKGLGCTLTQAPTAPYPAYLGMTNYSKNMYATDWDPYNGHGWFGFGSYHSMGWYDDGTKAGIVVPVQAPEGWVNTTVLASPAPTIDTSTYFRTATFFVSSTSTHDGLNINPGDVIWVETCAPGVDLGCSRDNGRNLSIGRVVSVNPSTGQVVFQEENEDFGSGNHVPVVGGAVYFGCIYAHGSPTCSRGTYRLQIYDPTQYAQVIAGTKQPYDVRYNQEMDLNPFVSSIGCPSCATRADIDQVPISTITDPSAHQIIIAFNTNTQCCWNMADTIYVFNVAGGTTTPTLTKTPTPTATPTSTPTPTPTPILRGDLNKDGIVNSIDWSIMNARWFKSDALADLNGDGIVNSIDFSILNANWFKRS